MSLPKPHAPSLTQRQLARLETLPGDYKLVRVRDGIPIVESPNGQVLSLRRTGNLVASAAIDTVESYLHVQRG